MFLSARIIMMVHYFHAYSYSFFPRSFIPVFFSKIIPVCALFYQVKEPHVDEELPRGENLVEVIELRHEVQVVVGERPPPQRDGTVNLGVRRPPPQGVQQRCLARACHTCTTTTTTATKRVRIKKKGSGSHDNVISCFSRPSLTEGRIFIRLP